ncbi:MAG: bacillithiol biosynthesis deacetylase BshB1 [bacterium]
MSTRKSSYGIDLLAFGAHPDDVELTAGGTLAKAVRQGYAVGIVDATRGELGTRGSVAVRAREAARAARSLGVRVRENLGLPDGHLSAAPDGLKRVVEVLRTLRPRVVIAPYWESRHPDHRALSNLVRDACFFAGVKRWPARGLAARPAKLIFAIAYTGAAPSFYVDVSRDFSRKLNAIRAYRSQVVGQDRLGDVFPSGRPLLNAITVIHAGYGASAQVEYAEPFWMREAMRVDDVTRLPLISM